VRGSLRFTVGPKIRVDAQQFQFDHVGQMRSHLARKALSALSALCLSGALCGCNRPYILTRLTAANAIESTAEFQHKTKLYFESSQAEGIIPGVCHNFAFAPDRIHIFEEYRKRGDLQFSKFGNQSPPYPIGASAGSLDLSFDSGGKFLTDDIEPCIPRQVKDETGAYELRIGAPVIEVNGIRKDGNRAHVDFTWHFRSLNQVGRTLLQGTRDMELHDDRLSPSARLNAPFWNATAELLKYDDGWRVVSIQLGRGFPDWGYGPEHWPDPEFDWHTFDEDENHW